MSMPVESAFSAGGMSMSARSEVQVPLGTGEEVASWRPSAASALASLVKEEMDALSKPASAMAMEPALAGVGGGGGGLLDLPPADDRPPPAAARTNGHGDGAGAAPRGAPAANPYLANSAPTYSSPAIAQYRPPPPEKDNKMLYIFGGLALVVVLLVGIGVIVSLNRQPVAPVVVQAPTPAQPVPAQPAPTQPVVAQPAPAQPAPTQPVAAPAQPGTATAQPPAQVAPTPAQPVAPTPAQPAAPRPTRSNSGGGLGNSGGGEKAERKTSAKEEKAPVEPPSSKKGAKEEEDDFTREFGADKPAAKKGEKAPEREAQSEPKRPPSYIPPAPGQANIPDSLAQADIVGVVVENKPGLLKCVAEQKAKDPSVKGKLAMKWTILPSGKTSNVSCVTEEFKSSAMAACMGALIKGMTFPKHKKQGEPITFPFNF